MLTYEDIVSFAAAREVETITLEVKSFKILPLSGEASRDIAYEIVAFSNRYGGKIVFGIKNDGTFDGKFPGDIDGFKGQLHNICHDHISPIVDCDIQFLESGDADFVIMDIKKREGIPHAYTEKKGIGIRNRVYYIRTSHGKKLVSDWQLEWLFKSKDDPEYKDSFGIGLELNNDLVLVEGPIPMGNYTIYKFFDFLNEKQQNLLKTDPRVFSALISELMPFMVLYSIRNAFDKTWHIQIEKSFDRVLYGEVPMRDPYPTNPVAVDSIKLHGFDGLIGQFKNIKDHFVDIFSTPFHLPPGTDIQIYYRARIDSSLIRLVNEDFEMEIEVLQLRSGAGLHPGSTSFEIYFDQYKGSLVRWSASKYVHFDAECRINITFNFPEYDMGGFELYFSYHSNLKNLLHEFWDFESERKRLPEKGIVVLNSKLDEILKILKS
jgi:hypothetical protein